jgi:hypothetical protein
VVTFCILALYQGYSDGGTIYAPSFYPRVITFRICEDYITMDPNKGYYFEKVYSLNSGIFADSTLKTLAFQDIYDSTYCGLLSFGIYQYNSATLTFDAYTGTDIYWDTDDLEFHYKTTTAGINTYYIKALTYGSKAVDYTKIKITICGAETLTPISTDVLFYSFAYSAAYTGGSIPWSTIETWITFDAGIHSDVTCRDQTKGSSSRGINLFTTNTYLSIWGSTSFINLV